MTRASTRQERRLRKLLVLLSAFLPVLLFAAFLSAPPKLISQDADQQLLLQAVNHDRADHGVGPLRWDEALARAAGAHAQLMTGGGELSHQYPGEADLVTRTSRQGAHFGVVAENIALGPSPLALEKEWMNSPVHRANILDPRLNAIGIGLVRQGSSYYGVQDFSDAVPELTPQQIEAKVSALLAKQGIRTTGSERDARQTCEMAHGSAGGSTPKFIVRWESANLNELPPQLTQQLATGRFHTAAVGACDSAHPQQGFTTYRVAVLLY